MTSIETSFEILLSQNMKIWTLKAEERAQSSGNTDPFQNIISREEEEITFNDNTSFPNLSPQPCTLSMDLSSAPATFVGLMNKGNTCYANIILQCLRNLPECVHNCFNESKEENHYLLSTQSCQKCPSHHLLLILQIF